jgi:hypothetical protein
MEITVIIPIHEFNEDIKKYYDIALDSIRKQEKIEDERPNILVVYAAGLEENELFNSEITKTDDVLSITYLKNEGKTDFQSQINFGADNIDTKYFTFIEFDDEFSTTFFYQAEKHLSKLKNVDLLLPIIIEVTTNQNGIKLTNETVWSKQFVGENGTVGYLNSNALAQYTDFKINGGVFNTESFINVGKLKSNIKLSFTYELLLRMTNNGDRIFTMPKIGYKHLIEREDALFTGYADEKNPNYIPLPERKFWFETAKKEANFFKDREIDLTPLNL